MTDAVTSPVFAGFSDPHSNFTEMPLALIDALPLFRSLAELKVILYVLRHTWGYREYDEGKRISVDEFENGRKRRDGSRIDAGVGMVKNSILGGIEKAIEDGFLQVEVDDHDKARVVKYYSLRSLNSGVQKLNPGVQDLNPGIPKVERRTEIHTSDKDSKKEESLAALPRSAHDLPDDEFFIVLSDRKSIIRVPILPSHIPSGQIALQGKIIKADEQYQSFKLVLAAPLPERKPPIVREGMGIPLPVPAAPPPIEYAEPAAPKTQPHVALIEAWHWSIPDDLRPIGKPVIDRNCAVAKELLDAGISPYDVVRFVTCTYVSYRAWAVRNRAPKVMTLEHIKKFLPAFMAKESMHEPPIVNKQYPGGSNSAPRESRASAVDPAKERELADKLFREIDERAAMRALQGNGLLPDRKTG